MSKPKVRCINCNKIIAAGTIQKGDIEIQCRNCGTLNVIEAKEPEPKKFGDDRKTGIYEPQHLITKGTKRPALMR